MKTAYYTFTTWIEREQAAGFGHNLEGTRHTSLVREQPHKARPQVGDNVIDLAAWQAANLDASREEPDWDGRAMDEPQFAASPRQVRKSHRAMFLAELVSTLSVVAVSAAIIIRVLTF